MTALLRQGSRINFKAGELVFEEGSKGHLGVYRDPGCVRGVLQNRRSAHTHRAHRTWRTFRRNRSLAKRPRSALEDSVAIRLSKRAGLSEQKAAVQLYRNMAQLMAKRLIHVDEEVILHKTGQYNTYTPDTKPPDGQRGGYTVVRR